MLLVVIFLVFITLFITGEPVLHIYKTINGTNYPLSAVERVLDGNNLTLNCRDVSSNGHEVSWIKKSEFHNDLVIKDSSTINFLPVKPSDDGIYVCSSLNTNSSKSIAIVVYSKNRRSRRTQYGIGSMFDPSKTFKPGEDFPTINIDDPVGDFFKLSKNPVKPTLFPNWFEKLKELNSQLNLDESENWPTYVRPGSNWYLSSIASGNVPSHTNTIFDDLYKKSEDKIVESHDSPLGSNQYTILYCMVIFGGLLMFGGIMCMCVRNNPSVRAHLDRTTSLNPACTHAMCVRHRDTNPLAGCILSTLNATNRIPTPMVHTNEDGDVTVLTFPNENVESIDFEDLPDTPPSYSNTVDDVKTDLPPSYEEVLENMLPPSYSTYQSTSTAIDAPASQLVTNT